MVNEIRETTTRDFVGGILAEHICDAALVVAQLTGPRVEEIVSDATSAAPAVRRLLAPNQAGIGIGSANSDR